MLLFIDSFRLLLGIDGLRADVLNCLTLCKATFKISRICREDGGCCRGSLAFSWLLSLPSCGFRITLVALVLCRFSMLCIDSVLG